MNLFIDTNVFLSFYHFTSDDLEELRKLAVLLRRKDVTLLLPEQVVNEFRRNRAGRIAEAIRQLRDQKLNLQFPQLCKDYEEYDKLRSAQQEYRKFHAALIQRLENDIAQENLKADLVIQELFGFAKSLPTSASVFERARRRMDLGNPPGKKGSLGDAVVWESLLEVTAKGEALHFVSDDGDYFSPLDTDSFDPYLLHEWATEKNSRLYAYKRLSSFLRDVFPDIKLASELEKDLLIRDLANSASFSQTHAIIPKLSRFSDFTPEQVNAIVMAAVSNNQIYWIADDSDVRRFLERIAGAWEDQIDPENLRRLLYALKEMEPSGEIL
jgi:predicted nucleic acid-binding protein